ncbi:MAG: response regulator [Saprospiraceae bacterium]|nr:response regulator [Saprospiraceae bacterium]
MVRKKILVIEDNQEVRDNICEILSLSDYEVESAANGKLGVEKAKRDIPDLIICDVMMPELDGYGVLHILSNNEQTAYIPFIFLSAKTDKEDIRRGMNLGADDYITKPFDNEILLQIIQNKLKKYDAIRSHPLLLHHSHESFKGIKFNKFENSNFSELFEKAELRNYLPKEHIFKTHQIPRAVYYIEKGMVKTSILSENGKDFITHLYKPKDFFGYESLFKGVQYQSDAIAIDEVTLYRIEERDFFEAFFSKSEIMIHFVNLMATNNISFENRLVSMAYNSVRKRVADTLVLIATLTGDNIINMSREDLSALVGTAKETLIRTISDFKSERLIKMKDHSIIINDIVKLSSIVN